MDALLVLLALVAGAGLPVQAAVNATMRSYIGRPEWAAVVNFGVGFLALLAWVAVLRLPPALSRALTAPWWAWCGGLLGAFYVTSVVLLAPRLGVAATVALVVTGQLGMALALDHFGALGMLTRQVTAGRLVGAALLVAGVVLIQR